MDLRQAGNRPHDPAGADVDLDDLAGAQMRHKQQTTTRIETGVVEPGIAARQGNPRHNMQARRPHR
jgi:hypothetical protein